MPVYSVPVTIELTAEKLADKLSRSKKVREMAANVAGKVLNEE